MGAANIEDVYELSPVQQGMLYHTLLSPPESGVYFLQLLYTLEGNLDTMAFAEAWRTLIARHPVFRTAFFWKETDKPLQVVHRELPLPLHSEDWRALSAAEQQMRLAEFLEADKRAGFDLSEAPLLRLTLIRTGDTTHEFVWSSHYLLFDGWSMALLLQELLVLYETQRVGEPSPLPTARPFRDYILWLHKQDLEKAKNFWQRHLQGVTSSTPLVVDRPLERSAEPERYAEAHDALPTETTAALQTLARQLGVTLSTLAHGAWALLLHAYSGEEHIVFGTVVSGRPASLRGVETIVGALINTLPLHVPVTPTMALGDWLQALQQQQVEMREYEYSPLVDVQMWSEIPRGQPLFESIFIFENYPNSGALEDERVSLKLRPGHVLDVTNYPLTVTVVPGNELAVVVAYDCRRFTPDTIERLLGHYQMLLTGMVTHPLARLVDLPLLTESEQQQLAQWNATTVDYAESRCVHELFEAQAVRAPETPALIFETQQLSYQELNQRANQLAHYLRAQGVSPDVLVGVCVERSVEMVVALLAILKAGGAYIPLDPTYPPDRLRFMLEDAAPALLLTQQHVLAHLPAYQGQTLCLDSEWELVAAYSTANPARTVSDAHLAYTIYTSGSTGQPKGAMNTHGALRNRLLWMQAAYQLNVSDRVLQKTPFSFDVSVWEFFWPLIVGACLVVARPEGHKDPAYLIETINQRQVTTLHFVPSMLRHFLAAPHVHTCASLKRVICSGEALPLDLQTQFFTILQAELHNLYGPTEAAIDVTYWACQPADGQQTVPIGRPIANTQIWLLDAHLRPTPIGVPGELHIGGAGLARGYLARPGLTAERFIPNPLPQAAGERLYKTGDLARYLPDGAIEYLGRLDFQVKLRGFRIELGEIETLLAQHPAMCEVAVILREDRVGDPRLVAYVVAQSGATPEADALRSFLKPQLPEYMIPAAFVMLESLPLSPNGKLDRRALPAPELASAARDSFIAPGTPLEEKLAEIWRAVLGVPQVGVHDNFFALGGNSLLALQVLAQAGRAGIELTPHQIMTHQTVAELATALEPPASDAPIAAAPQPGSNPVCLQSGNGRPPLFLVHPSSGEVLCFMALARHLGPEYPVYGLQSPDLYTDDPPITDIPTMAARYVEAMRSVQPAGPYYLGGWSGGGNIALEMAAQLQQQGQLVAFLGMIDSLPRNDILGAAGALLAHSKLAAGLYQAGGQRGKKLFHRLWRASWRLHGKTTMERTRDANHAAVLMQFIGFFEQVEWGRTLGITHAALAERSSAEQLAYLLDQMQQADIASAQDDLQVIRRRTEVTLANSEAVNHYTPALYPGKVTYFRAADAHPEEILDVTTFFDGPTQGWQQYFAQPAEVHTVPGYHFVLMDEPHVSVLAATLRSCLERAQQSV